MYTYIYADASPFPILSFLCMSLKDRFLNERETLIVSCNRTEL